MHLMSANIPHPMTKLCCFVVVFPKRSPHNTVPKNQLLSKAWKDFAQTKEHMSTVEVLEIFNRNTRSIVLILKVT